MPFPVDPERITAAEHELGFKFPAAWRSALERHNGGEFELRGEDWQVYPVWDNSDRKRAGRTTNDVRRETVEARKWHGFPAAAVALAGNGHGDLLVALPGAASIYRWDHEEVLIEDLGDLDPLALMDDAE